MKTAIETDRDGKPIRVYHRAGSTPEQGADTKFAWTHPIASRGNCSACGKGTIPEDVKTGTRGAA